jgi:hypothetical protein
MRRFFVVVGGLGFLCGCAALDSAVGLNPDGSVEPGGGAVGAGSSLLGTFVPWAGAALGAIGTLYSQIRRKKYANALSSTINGISAVRALRAENGTINLTDEKLVQILRDIQEADKTKKLISKVVKKESENHSK